MPSFVRAEEPFGAECGSPFVGFGVTEVNSLRRLEANTCLDNGEETITGREEFERARLEPF